MKMKMQGRYDFGWSDPRAIFNEGAVASMLESDYAKEKAKQFKTVTTKVLRDLWLVRWGSRFVPTPAVITAVENEEPVVGAMRELGDRGQVTFKRLMQAATMEDRTFYELEREDGDR